MSTPTIIADVTETVSFYPRLNSIPRTKRAPKAMRILKEWVQRHLKVELENILIDQEVNEFIWSRGIQKPPRRITITARKAEDGVVEVYLASQFVEETTPLKQVPVSDKPTESEIDDDEEEDEEKD
jgi:large subunit ribosomal protein L31e